MKVFAISFKSDTNNKKTNMGNLSHVDPFLFNANIDEKKDIYKSKSYPILTSMLALLAVGITILNLKSKNRPSLDIVNIADQGVGLNKITEYRYTVNTIKNKLLYPIKATIDGCKYYKYGNKLNSGLLLTGDDPDKLSKVMGAFCEHAKELKIDCISMPANLGKQREQIKWANAAIDEAKQKYKETKKFTIINLENMSEKFKMMVNKSTEGSFEKKLQEINKTDYPGVIWAGWTTEKNAVPTFYNKYPVVKVQLMD